MSHLLPSRSRRLYRASAAEIKRLDKQRSRGPVNLVVPVPELFASLASNTNGLDAALPSVAECAVHLALLEAFYRLRLEIVNSQDLDGTFGVRLNNAVRETRNGIPYHRDRAKKWQYFLGIAAGRFIHWSKEADAAIRTENQEADGSETRGNGRKEALYLLPPIDILMVWHAFLLNPKDFADYCERANLQYMREASFPWSQIHTAINNDDWSFRLAEAGKTWTKTVSGMEPDLFRYLVQVGKTEGAKTAKVLERYGGEGPQTAVVPSADELEGLSPEERAFLDMVSAATAPGETLNKQLVGNVERQVLFVDKMHRQLWIRSPAVQGTLGRAVDRYGKFLQLLALYPQTMLAPTLDIDLVWHTHLCSAARYRASMADRVGRFLNHNNRTKESLLTKAEKDAERLFLIRFGHQYCICLCWECEAIASALEETDVDDDGPLDTLAIRVRSDVESYRSIELARRRGQSRLPLRDNM